MKDDLKGFLYVGISTLCFSFMALGVKLSSICFAEIVFIRSLFQAMLSLCQCYKAGINPLGPKNMRVMLFLNGVITSLSLLLYFYCVKNGNMGDVTAIFFAAPALCTFLASMVTKEAMNKYTILSILLCFIGTVLVVKPAFLFAKTEQTSNIILLIASSGAIISSLSYLTLTMIGNRVHYLNTVFYFGLMSTLSSFIPMLLSNMTIPNPINSLILLSILFFAYTGQSTLNYGMRLTTSSATLIRNLDIVFAFIYSYFIFNEDLSLLSIIGAILICAGTAIIAIEKYKAECIDDDSITESLLDSDESKLI